MASHPLKPLCPPSPAHPMRLSPLRPTTRASSTTTTTTAATLYHTTTTPSSSSSSSISSASTSTYHPSFRLNVNSGSYLPNFYKTTPSSSSCVRLRPPRDVPKGKTVDFPIPLSSPSAEVTDFHHFFFSPFGFRPSLPVGRTVFLERYKTSCDSSAHSVFVVSKTQGFH